MERFGHCLKSGILLVMMASLVGCNLDASISSPQPSETLVPTQTSTPVPTPEPTPTPRATPAPTPTPDSSSGLNMYAPVVRTWTETASREYYNSALQLQWQTPYSFGNVGDWRDADNVPNGSNPFASVAVFDTDSRQVIDIDVTNLVIAYGADFRINKTGGTNVIFYSREAADANDRPVLLVTRSGVETTLQASADTSLTASTYISQGSLGELRSQEGFMIRFPQGSDGTIDQAILRLTTTSTQYGNQTLKVFRPDPHPVTVAAPSLALGTNADIVLHLNGVSGTSWATDASAGDLTRNSQAGDGAWVGAVPAGGDTGVDTRYRIPIAGRATEMFMRTVMKLHASFDPNWSGKMPGLSNQGVADGRGTICGDGGVVADGTCWSAATFFNSTPFDPDWGADYLNFGAYAYRYNFTTTNGEGPVFNYPIKREQFFVMDQRVKLNSINSDSSPASDGELTYWLNGVPVLHWTGIVWRTSAAADTLPSEAWPNISVGGTGYSASYPHGYTIYSITVSQKLLPYDPSLLTTLNGP